MLGQNLHVAYIYIFSNIVLHIVMHLDTGYEEAEERDMDIYLLQRSEQENLAAWGMAEFPYGMDHVDGEGD